MKGTPEGKRFNIFNPFTWRRRRTTSSETSGPQPQDPLIAEQKRQQELSNWATAYRRGPRIGR